MSAVLNGLIVILGLGVLGSLAPLPSNPRGAILAAVVAALAAFGVAYALVATRAAPDGALQPLATAALVGVFLAVWRLVGGPGGARAPSPWARPRTDGLETGVFLQLNLASVLAVAAVLVGAGLLLSGAAMPQAQAERLLLPALGLLGAASVLLVAAELVRVRRRIAPTGAALPIGQAFALCLWRWTLVAWTGLVFGLVVLVQRPQDVGMATLLTTFIALFVVVPAAGILSARALEQWTGTPLLQGRRPRDVAAPRRAP